MIPTRRTDEFILLPERTASRIARARICSCRFTPTPARTQARGVGAASELREQLTAAAWRRENAASAQGHGGAARFRARHRPITSSTESHRLRLRAARWMEAAPRRRSPRRSGSRGETSVRGPDQRRDAQRPHEISFVTTRRKRNAQGGAIASASPVATSAIRKCQSSLKNVSGVAYSCQFATPVTNLPIQGGP